MKINITKQNGVVLKTAGKLCNEDITVAPVLQDKTVHSNFLEQQITADEGYNGLRIVTVEKLDLHQSIYIAPATYERTISALDDYGKVGIQNIIVAGVTASIDPNIVASNIKKGVTILGVTGTYEGEVTGFKVKMSVGVLGVTVYDGQTKTGTGIDVYNSETEINCTSGYLLVTTGSSNYFGSVSADITGNITGELVSCAGSGYDDQAILFTVGSDGSILNLFVGLD